jgi:REP element-mobilizing transposase RayT
MSRTFTNLLTHLIFSIKDREPLMVPEIKFELFAYLGGLTRELTGKAYGITGTTDHVHMLINLPPAVSISEALRFIKSNSSGWVHDKWPRRSFAWQLGYGGFSVSKSNAPDVLKYSTIESGPSRMSSSISCASMRLITISGTSGLAMPPAFAGFESRRVVYPQLALWATGMTSAAPTEAFPRGRVK